MIMKNMGKWRNEHSRMLMKEVADVIRHNLRIRSPPTRNREPDADLKITNKC